MLTCFPCANFISIFFVLPFFHTTNNLFASFFNGADKVSLRFCLHSALAFEGQSDAISCLIEAKADVNERLQIPMSRRSWWGLLKIYHAAHYVSPSKLTTLAYHHYGASPLIFSILTGKFECIPILLAAGARLDIPNDRGKTASDFLQQMSLPEPCVEIRSATNGANDEDSDDCISIWYLCDFGRLSVWWSNRFCSYSPPSFLRCFTLMAGRAVEGTSLVVCDIIVSCLEK